MVDKKTIFVPPPKPPGHATRQKQIALAVVLVLLAGALIYLQFFNRDTSHDILDVRALSGFDSAGEPEIHIQKNGALLLIFKVFPPADINSKEAWLAQNFTKQLSDAVACKVVWEENEIFRIADPKPETIDKVAQFIASYRKTYANDLR